MCSRIVQYDTENPNGSKEVFSKFSSHAMNAPCHGCVETAQCLGGLLPTLIFRRYCPPCFPRVLQSFHIARGWIVQLEVVEAGGTNAATIDDESGCAKVGTRKVATKLALKKYALCK